MPFWLQKMPELLLRFWTDAIHAACQHWQNYSGRAGVAKMLLSTLNRSSILQYFRSSDLNIYTFVSTQIYCKLQMQANSCYYFNHCQLTEVLSQFSLRQLILKRNQDHAIYCWCLQTVPILIYFFNVLEDVLLHYLKVTLQFCQ